MLRLISLCLALLAGADALKLPSVVSRRDLATYAAGAIAALPLAANAAAGTPKLAKHTPSPHRARATRKILQ